MNYTDLVVFVGVAGIAVAAVIWIMGDIDD